MISVSLISSGKSYDSNTFCRFETISEKLKAPILVIETFSALLSNQKLFRRSTGCLKDRKKTGR